MKKTERLIFFAECVGGSPAELMRVVAVLPTI